LTACTCPYVECKVADEPTESQARWLAAAVDLGVVTVRDFVVVQAAITHPLRVPLR